MISARYRSFADKGFKMILPRRPDVRISDIGMSYVLRYVGGVEICKTDSKVGFRNACKVLDTRVDAYTFNTIR